MKRVFVYDPENPRREGVMAFLCQFIREAGRKVQITVADPTRTLEQNRLMWAMLGDLSEQLAWMVDGEKVFIDDEEWKTILTAGLRRDTRMAKGIDGGTVLLGLKTSTMTKAEMSDLIELMHEFGARHDIGWTDDEAKARAYEREQMQDSAPTTDTRGT